MESGKELASWCCEVLRAVESEIRKIIVGMDEIVEGVLVALAAGGHVLLEESRFGQNHVGSDARSSTQFEVFSHPVHS